MNEFYKILIIENSGFDLSKLDFSFLNFSILNIEDDKFKNYISQNFGQDKNDLKFIYDYLNEYNSTQDKYAILRNDDIVSNQNSRKKIINPEEIYKFLLIINPSIQLTFQILYDIIEKKKSIVGIKNLIFYPIEKEFINDKQIPSINRFAEKYFQNNSKLFKKIVSNYCNSFLSNQETFQYISLFTCLENLLFGNFDSAYKIQRICAILNGDNFLERQILFANLKLLKDLRNNIVHGGSSFTEKQLKNKLSYLRIFVSVLIVRLLFIDNKTFEKSNYNEEEINKWITSVGFSENLFIDSENFINESILNIGRKKIIQIPIE